MLQERRFYFFYTPTVFQSVVNLLRAAFPCSHSRLIHSSSRFIHPPGFTSLIPNDAGASPRGLFFPWRFQSFFSFFSFLVAFIPHTYTHFRSGGRRRRLRLGNRLMLYKKRDGVLLGLHPSAGRGELVPRPIYMIRTRLVDGEGCHLLNV